MPTLALYERQRARVRARPRQEAKGNFITARVFAQWYSLTFPETPKHYVKNIEAPKVYSKAIGYYDNPPIKPPWVPLASGGSGAQLYYPPSPQTPPRSTIPNPPQGSTLSQSLRGRPGLTGAFAPGIVARQLNATKLPCLSFDILARSTNAASIWYGYNPHVTIDNGFPLAPGAGKELDIGDISQVWFVAANATDIVYFDYTE